MNNCYIKIFHLFCRNRFDSPETNSISLATQAGNNRLYAGCGDNAVHVWDIDSGSLMVSNLWILGNMEDSCD